MVNVNQQWRLKAHAEPDEIISSSHFELTETAVPDIKDNEVLVRTLLLGTSPAQRAYIIENRRFHSGIAIGDVMHCRGIGVVERSNNPAFVPGDIVQGSLGWQNWSVQRADLGPEGTINVRVLQKLNKDIRPISLLLGTIGNAGFTALYGLERIGELAPGKTVVVSAAAGGVGSVAGQIAHASGAQAIGITGGAEKCEWLTEYVGYDAAIDYKSEDVGAALSNLCPDGIDIYFDNVGGPLLDTILQQLSIGARIILCGHIATEYLKERAPGPAWYNELIYRRARMEGFVIWDHIEFYSEMSSKLRDWYEDGLLKPVEDISHGLETAPESLASLFRGTNRGVKIIQVAEDTA